MSEGHKDICKVFASGKTCKFGKRCRYLHFRHPSHTNSENRDSDGAVNSQLSGGASYSRRPTSRDFPERKENEAVSRNEYSVSSRSHSEVPEGYTPLRYEKKKQDNIGGTANKSVCRFYLRTGTCRFGRNCQFLHDKNGEDGIELAGAVLPSEEGPSVVTEVAVCTFYQKGECKFGDQCTKSHAKECVIKASDGSNQKKSCAPEKSARFRSQRRFELTIDLKSSSSDEKKQIRAKEIQQLTRRYPKAERTTCDTGDSFQFTFNPSDPDWPYDVKAVEMKVMFADTYPETPMEITIIDDEILPNTLRRHIWKCTQEWISSRFENLASEGKAEMVYKPFHKWFDRNLEEMFTVGLKLYQKELMAKASGIELIAASELQEQLVQRSSDEDNESEDGAEEHGTGEEGQTGSSEEEHGEEIEKETVERGLKGFSDPARKGTEIKLHNLQLKENTATLRAAKVHFVIQCGRCKDKIDLVTPPERVNCLQCSRCHASQYVTFRPTLAHQFSNVMGYLDLQECSVFDMVLAESEFMAGCLNCNNDVEFGNVAPGQAKDTWCKRCHAKMRVAVDCAKFQQLQPSGIVTDTKGVHIEKSKVVKAVKDPAIVEGKPLPDDGSCRHYKKSFRWFRFPCCGKAYPCDLCHDHNESHEMLFANRMICGFCAKEQVYTGDRPCKGCNSSLTKKFTEHWEGGKGCRDRIKMSRGDAKKYADQSKTISRKAQNTKPSGGKSSKLRHA